MWRMDVHDKFKTFSKLDTTLINIMKQNRVGEIGLEIRTRLNLMNTNSGHLSVGSAIVESCTFSDLRSVYRGLRV